MINLRATILCIDDDASNLLVRKALLQSVGYSVLIACTGSEGLALFLDCPVSAVVLDFEMPDVNGADVAAEMKRLRPDIPIVMLSAHDDLTVDELQNTDTYLVKGNDSSALFATLARLTAPAMSHRSVQGLQRAA